MSKIDDGGSAFPVTQHLNKIPTSIDYIGSVGGMSLRDLFAAAALNGIVAKSPIQQGDSNNKETEALIKKRAAGAYRYADAMLAARKESSHDDA